MPDLRPSNRMLPSLLVRLTDDEPRSTRESRDQRVVSPRQYVRSVRDDLRSLLNSRSHAPESNIYHYPEASRSVLNYGVPDLCGLTTGGIDVGGIERRLREAILAFEPRLLRETLDVQVSADVEAMSGSAVTFEISSRLWMQPAPEHFYVKTQVDLETGQWEV